MSKGSLILSCNCKHKYQDRIYGMGKRVHNRTRKKQPGDPPQARCTSCGTMRRTNEST